MKLTNISIQNVAALVFWATLAQIWGLHVATLALSAFLAMRLMTFAGGAVPKGTAMDSLLSWGIFIFIAVGSYPYTVAFSAYVAVTLLGKAVLHVSDKEYMENE